MKILVNADQVTVTVNGCEITVPRGTKYLAISWTGSIRSFQKKPSLNDGFWEDEDGNIGTFICAAELEDSDQWTQVFLVDKNRFRTYDDCDA